MARISSIVAGIVTAAVALGSVQLQTTSGNALEASAPRDWDLQATARAESTVNRSGKGDRLARPFTFAGESGPTLVFEIDGLPSTSIAAKAMKQPSGNLRKPKQAVACEGVVSVLTEVAKQLEPGRCIT